MAGNRDVYLQAIRGASIAAVALIHCLPQEAWVIAVRPFLNFAVAAFIFLSGYLTPMGRTRPPLPFYKKRAGKIAPPYVLWSAFYLLARRVFAPLAVVCALLIGGGSAQLYYLIVYLQLVFLTPLLYWMLDRRALRMALFAVTPVVILVRYALALASVSVPIQAFCGSWVVFYLIGMRWREGVLPWLERKGATCAKMVAIAFAFVVVQELEGFLWLALGNFDLATTQIKASNMLCAAAVLAALMMAGSGFRRRLCTCKPLVVLGDVSFGVYLCHMAPVMLWNAVLPTSGILLTLVKWAFVLGSSVVVILASRRVLPKRVLAALGFG